MSTHAADHACAVDAFRAYINVISRNVWGTAWVYPMEHDVWDRLQGDDHGYLTLRQIATLRWLSAMMQGWADLERAYTLAEWRQVHTQWQFERAARNSRSSAPGGLLP